MQTHKALSRVKSLGEMKSVQALKQAAIDWFDVGTFEMGAALAYYAVFAIAPMIVVTIAVASQIWGKRAAEGRILGEIQGSVGPTVAASITDTLKYSYSSGSGVWATVVGAVVFFSVATGLFGQLQNSLNTIWGVRPKPGRGIWGVIKDRFWSFVVVLGVGALLLGAVLVNAILAAVSGYSQALHIPGTVELWRAINFVVSWLFVTLALGLVYQVLPDVDIDWTDVWIGAAVSSLLFMLGNWLITLYLSWSGVRTTYGAAGSLIVLLLWVYYSAQVLLFGAEFTQAYARLSGKPLRPYPSAEPIKR